LFSVNDFSHFFRKALEKKEKRCYNMRVYIRKEKNRVDRAASSAEGTGRCPSDEGRGLSYLGKTENGKKSNG
jgi:hypothetical protein